MTWVHFAAVLAGCLIYQFIKGFVKGLIKRIRQGIDE